MKRRISVVVAGLVLMTVACVCSRRATVEVIGQVSKEDVAEICRVVGKAEASMEQAKFPAGQSLISLRRVRGLATSLWMRMNNGIVSITRESEGSVKVVSISGLWGKRPLRVEKRDGHWCFVRIIERNPNSIVL